MTPNEKFQLDALVSKMSEEHNANRYLDLLDQLKELLENTGDSVEVHVVRARSSSIQ